MQASSTRAGLRGIHAVGNGVAWASGSGGTVLRTEDGGYMWQNCALPPGAGELDFRAVWAWDEKTAVVMSSGPGDRSRLYRTADGCASWRLLATNPERAGFWDAMVFLDREHGLILGDPVEGRFVLLETTDGGSSWRPLFPAGKSAAGDGLTPGSADGGAFAASNSSLAVVPPLFCFGSGGSGGGYAHCGRLADGAGPGRAPVPLASGSPAAGGFSLAFRDGLHGVAVGGDYRRPESPAGTAAWSEDGGKSWHAAGRLPRGYRSAVAWDTGQQGGQGVWIAVGPNGTSVSEDDGRSWLPLPDRAENRGWNALSLPWVVGPGGRIGRLNGR
jgi:photosystem II stability/assembly factor-like uncharacterized protein